MLVMLTSPISFNEFTTPPPYCTNSLFEPMVLHIKINGLVVDSVSFAADNNLILPAPPPASCVIVTDVAVDFAIK